MEPKVVHTARSNAEAEIVKSWLEQDGVKASVINGEMNSGAFEIVETDPQVVVNAEDYDRAVGILEEVRKELLDARDLSNMSDAEGQFDWPICPVCDEMRAAQCSECSHVGSEFEDVPGSTDENVKCLACEATVSIVFVDKCHYCEHDYTGQTPDTVALSETRMESANSNRVLFVVGAILVLVILLVVWFLVTTNQ